MVRARLSSSRTCRAWTAAMPTSWRDRRNGSRAVSARAEASVSSANSSMSSDPTRHDRRCDDPARGPMASPRPSTSTTARRGFLTPTPESAVMGPSSTHSGRPARIAGTSGNDSSSTARESSGGVVALWSADVARLASAARRYARIVATRDGADVAAVRRSEGRDMGAAPPPVPRLQGVARGSGPGGRSKKKRPEGRSNFIKRNCVIKPSPPTHPPPHSPADRSPPSP